MTVFAVGSWFVFALVANLAQLGQAQAGLQCLTPGECLDSLILETAEITTPRKCLYHCQETTGCEWFTFYPDTKTCVVLSDCLRLNQTSYCPDCVSGEEECPEVVCGAKGKCIGALEGVREVRSVRECRCSYNKTSIFYLLGIEDT